MKAWQLAACLMLNAWGAFRVQAARIPVATSISSDVDSKCQRVFLKLQALLEHHKPGQDRGSIASAQEDIDNGSKGPKALDELERAISQFDLSAAMAAGQVITVDDLNDLAECELGEAETLEEHKTTSNGWRIFEGDMVLPPADGSPALIEVNGSIASSSLWAGELWKKGQVKFCYHPELEAGARRAFEEAVEHVMAHVPCVSFLDVGWDAEKKNCKRSSVLVQSHDKGCYSMVGKLAKSGAFGGIFGGGVPSQPLNLQRGCWSMGTAVHEILHALGMRHEHERNDRNSYIEVLYDNIAMENWRNFFEQEGAWMGTEYDPLSIMHYGLRSFSKNGQPTIRSLDPNKAAFIGNRQGLSQLDVHQLRNMYGCSGEASKNAPKGISENDYVKPLLMGTTVDVDVPMGIPMDIPMGIAL